jgi:hypothetical protein
MYTVLQDSLTGDIITDHRAIARRYLKGWFAIDVLATFPVDYIVRGVEVRGSLPAHLRHYPYTSAAVQPVCRL